MNEYYFDHLFNVQNVKIKNKLMKHDDVKRCSFTQTPISPLTAVMSLCGRANQLRVSVGGRVLISQRPQTAGL